LEDFSKHNVPSFTHYFNDSDDKQAMVKCFIPWDNKEVIIPKTPNRIAKIK
jgi:hypothetical protein